MSRFTYDDIVLVRDTASIAERRGQRAWVVGIFDDRNRYPLKQFSLGVVYTVEFEDGDAIDIHEDDLELAEDIQK